MGEEEGRGVGKMEEDRGTKKKMMTGEREGKGERGRKKIIKGEKEKRREKTAQGQ